MAWRSTHFLSAPHHFTFVLGKRIYAKNGESDFDLPGFGWKKKSLKIGGLKGEWLGELLGVREVWYLNSGRGTLKPPKLRRTVCGLFFFFGFLVEFRPIFW